MMSSNPRVSVPKFGEDDRELLRSAVERCTGKRLTRALGSRRKVMTDEGGNRYWLMGYGLWHAIAPDMLRGLDPERDHRLVVARRDGSKVRAFMGPLRPVLLSPRKLIVAQRGELHFDLAERSGHLYITQIPQAVLSPLTEYEVSPKQMLRANGFGELARLISAFSPAQREALFNKLSKHKSA